MIPLQVDPQSLRTLSATCVDAASELVGSGAPGVSGGSFQPSTAAVLAADADICAAAQRLAARMGATAEKLATTAADFEGQDETSALSIRAVAL